MATFRDPRLTNPLLLLLAGRRVQHRQAQPPPPDWATVEGLSGILDYAKRCGWQDQPAVADDELPRTGMSPLLREARAIVRAQEHGHEV